MPRGPVIKTVPLGIYDNGENDEQIIFIPILYTINLICKAKM